MITSNYVLISQVLKELTRNSQRKGAKQMVDVGSKAVEKKYGIKGSFTKNHGMHNQSMPKIFPTLTRGGGG